MALYKSGSNCASYGAVISSQTIYEVLGTLHPTLTRDLELKVWSFAPSNQVARSKAGFIMI